MSRGTLATYNDIHYVIKREKHDKIINDNELMKWSAWCWFRALEKSWPLFSWLSMPFALPRTFGIKLGFLVAPGPRIGTFWTFLLDSVWEEFYFKCFKLTFNEKYFTWLIEFVVFEWAVSVVVVGILIIVLHGWKVRIFSQVRVVLVLVRYLVGLASTAFRRNDFSCWARNFCAKNCWKARFTTRFALIRKS